MEMTYTPLISFFFLATIFPGIIPRILYGRSFLMRPLAGTETWQSPREKSHQSRIKAREAARNQALSSLNPAQTPCCTHRKWPRRPSGSLGRSERKPRLCSREVIKGLTSHITKELRGHGPECSILLCSLTLLETRCWLLRKKNRDWVYFHKLNSFFLYFLANCWGSCFYTSSLGKYSSEIIQTKNITGGCWSLRGAQNEKIIPDNFCSSCNEKSKWKY